MCKCKEIFNRKRVENTFFDFESQADEAARKRKQVAETLEQLKHQKSQMTLTQCARKSLPIGWKILTDNYLGRKIYYNEQLSKMVFNRNEIKTMDDVDEEEEYIDTQQLPNTQTFNNYLNNDGPCHDGLNENTDNNMSQRSENEDNSDDDRSKSLF